MRSLGIFGALCAFGLLAFGPAMAADSTPVPPDPTHIPFVPTDKIKWEYKGHGEYQAKLFGDVDKPGIYGILIEWSPGGYTHPHFHSSDRFIYVVQGTWWVSSSETYDPSKNYPLKAGSFATDLANTVHWDGARDEPCILELVGMGPVVTTQLGDKEH
jgi:quercetin dioxygenase-like cupin family protein